MPKRLLRMCKVVALVFRPTKINKQILKAYCFHVAAELETVTSTSCYSGSCLYSLLHPETSTRSEVCISPAWSLGADSWGAPCVKAHLTRDGESTQGSSSGPKGTFQELCWQWLAATVLCGFPSMEAMSQLYPSKKGKEIGAGAARNCLFLRTRETSTSSVDCVCPAWCLRAEMIGRL